MFNREKKYVVFHPGIGKTATSTIQEIGMSLKKDNIEKSCMCPYGVIGGANNAFATNHPLFEKHRLDEIISNSIRFILSRNAPTLISSEFLIRQPASDTNSLLNHFLLAGIDVKVFIGVRRYDELMLSSYLQALKTQYGKLDDESLAQYIEREIKLVRYPDLIDPWAKVVGNENIILFDFDEGRKSFVRKFFSTLNIDIVEEDLHEKQANPSLPAESIEIINSFDKVCTDKKSREEILSILMRSTYKDNAKIHHINTARSSCSKIYDDDKRNLTIKYRWKL